MVNRRWTAHTSPYFGCIKATAPSVILGSYIELKKKNTFIVKNFVKQGRRHKIEMQARIATASHFSREVGILDF